MKCPKCGTKTHTYSIRQREHEVYRSKRCTCGWKGSTRETITSDADIRANIKTIVDLADQLKDAVKNMASGK